MPAASTEASTRVGAGSDTTVPSPSSTPSASPAASAAPAAAPDTRVDLGTPAYRRMSLALFLAGVATFALLYSTQALLPLISASYGSSVSDVSWTVAAATGGLALFVIPMSALSERFGRRATMTGAVAVAVGIGLVVPFAPSLGVLVALRAVQGAALAGLPASATAYLAEEVRPRALITAIGLYVAGNSVGGMSGRVLTGWVAQEWGWRVALAVLGVLAVACAVAFRMLLPEPKHFTRGSLRPGVVVRTVRDHLGNPLLRRLYAIGALFMTVFGGVYTVIGYRLTQEPFSLPQGVVGSVFLVYLVGTVSASASGRLVGRFGRRGTLYLSGALTAAGLLVSLSDRLPAVLLGLVLVTGGFFAGHSAASSAVSGTALHGRAQAAALYQSAYYVGSSVGSTVGAVAFHAAGWGGTVAVGLLAVAGVAGITLLGTLAARRPAVAA
ncbi:MFS transporter [Streptomyces sp. UH6]|uniref:MFS transporter n=1 Tax=Streptomyces sp. UH6 TaxID=2748379 RepID=UPI0015D4D311|nr:MFS transporter [Streptomyces sp. UH6]NYV74161.1 MFS transporter [Streptomyces sp. UH6]